MGNFIEGSSKTEGIGPDKEETKSAAMYAPGSTSHLGRRCKNGSKKHGGRPGVGHYLKLAYKR